MRKLSLIILSLLVMCPTLPARNQSSGKGQQKLYSWERNRYRAPQFSNMVLCYGGSRHRKDYLWNQERFDSYVTYTDTTGREDWLFDAFLCLEFEYLDTATGTKYALMADQVDGPSGGKSHWEAMLDYWFSPDNGLGALDSAISSAAGRLGKPSEKHKVIMFMPDPIPYLEARNPHSSHVYWGEVDGRKLDFLNDGDRLRAYRWYVDNARERFAKGKYRNLELAGFYVMSECITIPSEPWTDHAKLHDVIPPLSEYLHSVNEYLYWIPFSQGAGWRRGRELGFDYVWMQPNHFWRGDDCPMENFVGYLRDEGVGMEFELDTKVYESNPSHRTYRDRVREYIKCAKDEGIYGSQPIAYYIDSNCIHELRNSESESDRAFYHEICSFVTGNPLRNRK